MDSLSRVDVTVAHLDDLPVGGLRMVRVDGRRICLVRTSEGVHAIDNTCPHEGYGMTQGTLQDDVITCAWHNWKFRVTDGACLQGEEDIPTHRVDVGDDGSIRLSVVEPDPEQLRPKLLASLRRGMANNYIGQVSRDVVRLLRASADPGELVWEAIAYGAPRAEFGWGHSVAAAVDCLSVLDLYEGDQRALPVVQAISGVAESERGRTPRPLPAPAATVPKDAALEFRGRVEAEDIPGAQALLLAAIERGIGTDEIRNWFTGAVSDHHLAYGHGAIYAQKAFQLLEHVGWDRSTTVLPYLLPTLMYGTREDLLPYMRPFMRRLATFDLATLAEVDVDPTWEDDGTLRAAILGRDRTAAIDTAAGSLQDGAGVDGVLDVVVDAVSERLLRYDVAGERDFEDDFGWLDITHGLTYANAVRWHHSHYPGPDTLRLALFCVFLAQWTGRHEWHSHVGQPVNGATPGGDMVDACLRRDPDAAVAAAVGGRLDDTAKALQQAALLDRCGALIMHVHAVKTARAAAEEAARSGSARPLAAAARYIAAPKLERFVAGTVVRSIDFVAGRVNRD